MRELLLNFQDLEFLIQAAVWIIGILLGAISVLCGLVLWYVIRMFKKTDGLDGKISQAITEIHSVRTTIGGIFSALHSSEKSVWEELIKVRRSLDSGTVVLKRRREEIDQILADSRRTKNQLEHHQKTLQLSSKIFKRHKAEFQLIRTKLTKINDDLILVSSHKLNGKGGK